MNQLVLENNVWDFAPSPCPDRIIAKNQETGERIGVVWHDDDAVTFMYVKTPFNINIASYDLTITQGMYVFSQRGKKHTDLIDELLIKSLKTEQYDYMAVSEITRQLNFFYNRNKLLKEIDSIMGRFWSNSQIISIWELEELSLSELKNLINEFVAKYDGHADIDKMRILYHDSQDDTCLGTLSEYAEELNPSKHDYSQEYMLHMMNGDEKRQTSQIQGYLNSRADNRREKFRNAGDMTDAEYNALKRPFSEAKKYITEGIAVLEKEEEIDKLVKEIMDTCPTANWTGETATFTSIILGEMLTIVAVYNPERQKEKGKYSKATNTIKLNLYPRVTFSQLKIALTHELTHMYNAKIIGKDKIGHSFKREVYRNLPDFTDKQIIKALNHILYVLWSNDEQSAFQTLALSNQTDYINHLCDKLESEINDFEDCDDESFLENLIPRMKVHLQGKSKRQKRQVSTAAFQLWFVKESRKRLDNFKHKLFKNWYQYNHR